MTQKPRSVGRVQCTESLPVKTVRAAQSQQNNASLASVLWLCIYLPRLPVDVLFAHSCKRAVVVEEKAGRVQVMVCNRAAMDGGIRPGMPLAAALALQQQTRVLQRDSVKEQQALDRLARWAFAFSSRISVYSGNSIMLEIRGSLRLFGGVTALLQRIKTDLEGFPYDYMLSGAPTLRAAFWLAQHDPGQIVQRTDELVSALGELPIEKFSPNKKLSMRMRRSGIRILADLIRLPRDGLGRRFGLEILEIVDQALARRPEVIEQYQSALVFSMEREFYLPTHDLNRIRPVAMALLQEFEHYLQDRQAATCRFQCKLMHLSLQRTLCEVECRHATSRAEHMMLLLEEKLSRLQLGADVISIVISSSYIDDYRPQQSDLFARTAENSQSWSELMEQFEARLGGAALQYLSVCPDHRPEYAFATTSSEVSNHAMCSFLRPLWLLKDPQRLVVIKGQPHWQGVLHVVQTCERLEQGWWDGRDVRRDYWVAHNAEGSKLWIYRDHRKEWFLHGIFA